jgi:hypothetical protein
VTVLDWFKPMLLEANPINEPTWLSDYEEFVSELKVNFGPYDPEGKAKIELENLRMRNGQQITKYFVEFNRLAACFIAVKSSVPQGMFVCFDKEVGWCVGIVVILVVGREQ